jgi:16S rRNA (adenine1518-N6/adenine1519-N6)-dimethyltransferase
LNHDPDRLRKDLGQHFLTRPEACAPLVDFLRPRDRRVVEIGPGEGALTGALLRAGARVVAWELDPRWAVRVSRRFAGARLATVIGDAGELPWTSLGGGWLAAGNLPYNVATRIILRLLEATVERPGAIERAAFLVQREVADRLTAGPSTAAYGSFSVLVATLAKAERLGTLAPGAFRPPPKVESAFVGLTPIASGLDAERWRRFADLVRAGFAQRRKTLRNSLSASLGSGSARALIAAAGLDRSIRAEALGAAELRTLFERWEELEGARGGARAADRVR